MSIYIALSSYAERYSTKYEILYHALREAITEGKLVFGDRLPASRELAVELGYSRGTVMTVLEALTAEGYVETRVGSGTYVSFKQTLPASKPAIDREVKLSAWGRRLVQGDGSEPPGLLHTDTRPGAALKGVYFGLGTPDMRVFPHETWNRCLHEAGKGMTANLNHDRNKPLGSPALREAIAKHLQRSRAIVANPRNIAIVNGSMQGIALLTQLLAGPEDTVVTEQPGYQGMRKAAMAAGARLVEGEVDEQGLKPQDWEAKLLFVTPNRQYPTGAVLSMERRQALLRWAAERGAFIVEDEYDSEFRHLGKPIETLKGLDKTSELVIYTGTFSKTLMTDLRLGFMVLPDDLVQPFALAKELYEPHPSAMIEQRALAAFMNSGLYERHLRRMRRIYSRKFLLLREELRRLDAPIRWIDGDAGLHIFGWWTGTLSQYEAYEHACREAGVEWVRSRTQPGTISICLGFAHLSEEEISFGLDTMFTIWSGLNLRQ